jgi:hypothetical protein
VELQLQPLLFGRSPQAIQQEEISIADGFAHGRRRMMIHEL